MTQAVPRDETFDAHLAEKNASALHVFALLAAVLVPLFWGLDWFIVPEHVWTILWIRLSLTVVALGVVLFRKVSPQVYVQQVRLLSALFTLACVMSIGLIGWLDDGYESPYYAGVGLAVLASGSLFTWNLRRSITVFGGVYIAYLSPLIVGLVPLTDLATVVNNQYFLISTLVILIAAQVHRYRLERRRFEGNQRLEEARASLQVALVRLQQLDRHKNEFFRNITHELRTPLTMILAPLESMLAGDLGRFREDQLAYLRSIWRNGFRLLKLVNDLLDLARIEEGYVKAERQVVDLGALLTDLCGHSRPLAARKDIDLDFAVVDPVKDALVDPDRIEQAVVNLLSNALKFTSPGGKVTVRLTRSAAPDEIFIAVTDTGEGIAPDKLEAIFERFAQADASTTRRYGGTGIGLSLAREVVGFHGGRLTVESTQGEGSTFTIVLPGPSVTPLSASADPQPADEPDTHEWSRQLSERDDYRFMEINSVTERRLVEREGRTLKATRVLVVDDNVDILRFVHLLLAEEHEVYLARDGRQGLELARRVRPDVIVSDYMMPEMDGMALTAALRADSTISDVPIVMLSAKQAVEDRLLAMNVGADVYLGKPFHPRELKAAVSRSLERRKQASFTVMAAHVQSLESLGRGLAHELSNPLSALRTSLFMIDESGRRIADEAVTPPVDVAVIDQNRANIGQMLDVANRGLDRIEKLITLVRQYSRQGFPKAVSEISADELVQDALARLGPDLPTATITQEMDTTEATIACVPDELTLALTHVLENAIKAAGPEGQVRVESRTGATEVIIDISDNGPGVPAADLSKVFTPFFTTREPGEGLGIGLTIAQHAVTRVGGIIEMRQPPAGGTLLRIRLPARGVEDDPVTSEIKREAAEKLAEGTDSAG